MKTDFEQVLFHSKGLHQERDVVIKCVKNWEQLKEKQKKSFQIIIKTQNVAWQRKTKRIVYGKKSFHFKKKWWYIKKRVTNWKQRLRKNLIRMRLSKLIWRNLVEKFENFSRHSSLQTKCQRVFLIRSFLPKTTIQHLKIDTST